MLLQQFTPQPIVTSPVHDSVTITLVLVSVFFVAVTYRRGFKYISSMWHSLLSARTRQNVFENSNTLSEISAQSALIFNACLMTSILSYVLINQTHPELFTQAVREPYRCVVPLLGLFIAFYTTQWVILRILGYTFLSPQRAELLMASFNASCALMGITLPAILVVALILPSNGVLYLSLFYFVYFIAKFLFLFRGFRIFYTNITTILHFILYLCIVEIVPLVAVMKMAITFCCIW